MVFSSVSFLFLFLPITLVLTLLTRGRARNYVLLVVSLFFYAWGEPIYILLMLGSSFVNYVLAYWLTGKHKKIALIGMVVFNLGLLGWFKYAGFIAQSLNVLGLNLPIPEVALPIGISFYTFQTMSYMFDVYRGETPLQRNYPDLLLYISFFPQLIAGPIVQYHDINLQIRERTITKEKVISGFQRFVVGLGKKVLLANQMAVIVDAIYAQNAFSWATAWVAAICYLFQIYFDFSGYSDMAIGLGRIFGFHFLENFDKPLTSLSVQDFWRRWHISLSTWFKLYVYIPLGGSRRSTPRVILNFFIVFFLTGLWHGANWTFVVWGLWQWLFIILERYVIHPANWPKPLQHLYTLLVVIFGFVIFRAESLAQAFAIFGQMLNPFAGMGAEASVALSTLINPLSLLIFALCIIASTYWPTKLRPRVPSTLRTVGLVGIWIFAILTLSASTYNPFIYFRF